MQNILKRSGKLTAMLLTLVLTLGVLGITANAEEGGSGSKWYKVDADFTAYVNAMGGVEFGAPMLDSVYVEEKTDGTLLLTMNLSKSVVTIYGVTCDTFIDPNYPIQYKSGGSFVDAEYTISEDTALDPNNVATNYADSITFDVSDKAASYELSVYINSNVMGVQFGQTQVSGSTYYSYLQNIDWENAVEVEESEANNGGNEKSATVTYTVGGVTGAYEVDIPSVITVDSATKTGAYEVKATNFDLADGAYVTIGATESGALTNESGATVDFTNVLSGTRLTNTGDVIDGEVSVTSTAASSGTYTGTIDFTITVNND